MRPGKGRRGELRFSFQDVIILRTAQALAAASIPVRRINQSLRQLQASLPPEMPLSGLSITSIGDQIAVREGLQQREIESGQYLLALNVITEGGEVRIIDHSARPPGSAIESRSDGAAAAARAGSGNDPDGDQLYLAGSSLEEDDPQAAIAAYGRCLRLDPDHYEARLNLGRLLHLSGRLKDAERVYREARRYDATLLFNLGVLLEDQNRRAQAISTYQEALTLDPTFADAHFNLARLYDRDHNKRETLKHLLAYRRLTR